MRMKYLTEKERYQIEILRKKKVPVKQIAKDLGRAESTIYREISLGTVVLYDCKKIKDVPVYCADVGQRIQDERSKNKGSKMKYLEADLRKSVARLLLRKYSPEAVRVILPGAGMSTGTIYNYIHKGLIPGYGPKDLIYPRKKKKKDQDEKRVARNHLNHTSIEDRPGSVLFRQDFGHWELDSVESGKGDKATLLCFSERKHRLELFFKVSGKTADNTVRILDRLERRLTAPVFREVFKTITVDNGCEFLDAQRMERSRINHIRKRTKVFYCHPYCSSERGTNENQNRFVRRFIPKGDYISLYKGHEIRQMQDFVNTYPRRMFGGLSALDRLALQLSLIHI